MGEEPIGVGMARRRRSSPQRGMQKEQWLRSGDPHRARRWAYDELLFGSLGDRERLSELRAVLEELEQARTELARVYLELDEHVTRISILERRLHELTPEAEREERRRVASTPLPHTRAAPPDTDARAASEDRSYSLARCEGFEVESPAGVIGFVEGLRFASRIDRPDLLEVRGGRFGRQLLLIPSEQVEEVRVDEERVLVRGVPLPSGDLLAEVVERVRRALHVDEAAS
jgi:hypothetical protein